MPVQKAQPLRATNSSTKSQTDKETDTPKLRQSRCSAKDTSTSVSHIKPTLKPATTQDKPDTLTSLPPTTSTPKLATAPEKPSARSGKKGPTYALPLHDFFFL